MYTKLQLVNTQTPERWVQPMAPSQWPLSWVLADWLLAFSGKQPLHRFSELATDAQQNLRPNFLFATFHIKRDAPNLLQSVLRIPSVSRQILEAPESSARRSPSRTSQLCAAQLVLISKATWSRETSQYLRANRIFRLTKRRTGVSVPRACRLSIRILRLIGAGVLANCPMSSKKKPIQTLTFVRVTFAYPR